MNIDSHTRQRIDERYGIGTGCFAGFGHDRNIRHVPVIIPTMTGFFCYSSDLFRYVAAAALGIRSEYNVSLLTLGQGNIDLSSSITPSTSRLRPACRILSSAELAEDM